MTKISKEVKAKVKDMAQYLPEYHERFKKRKLIDKKDVVEYYGVPEKALKNSKSITTTINDGARLIDASVHEKRMLNAIKKDPKNGYRNYLNKINARDFKTYTWWDHIKLYFGIHF